MMVYECQEILIIFWHSFFLQPSHASGLFNFPDSAYFNLDIILDIYYYQLSSTYR